MPASKTEKAIKHQRKRKGILVPMIEDFLRKPVNIMPEDLPFLNQLFTVMADREVARKNGSKVFSPSALSECLRRVYLQKHHDELGIPALQSPSVSANFYFLNGNFLHAKWQFVLYKMDRTLPDSVFKLLGVEVPLISKKGDHGGTLDVIALIHGVPYVIDFKGLNVRTFSEITRGFVPEGYAVQVSDYIYLFRTGTDFDSKPELELRKGLLVIENKGGPMPAFPAALHETVISLKQWKPEIKSRLEVLRAHEKEGTIPAPECESVNTFQFQGCPFAKFCRKEVKAIQKEKQTSEDSHPERLRVAIPAKRRNNRTRRNKRK